MSLAPFIQTEDVLAVGTPAVDHMLKVIREHLKMDVAFVARFRDDDRIFENVSAQSRSPISVGDSCPLEQGFCQRVVDGRLPELIKDAMSIPAARQLPETAAIPIGAHISVPVRMADGRLYGTLCCFSFSADPSLTERDLEILRAFSSLLGAQLDRERAQQGQVEEGSSRIREALSQGQPHMVYQPIFDIASGEIAGIESLARFNIQPVRTPDVWFAEAAAVGMSFELELAAIQSGLKALTQTPPNIYIAVNCSPSVILNPRFGHSIQSLDLRRIVLELTEHDHIKDYPALLAALAPFRAMGLRVSIDDAGAGYASLRHVLHIQPDKIKLDITLTRHIDTDSKRRALASALIAFGRETQAHIVAEGVETAAELHTLSRLGAQGAQGYFLARPMSLESALKQKFPQVDTSQFGQSGIFSRASFKP